MILIPALTAVERGRVVRDDPAHLVGKVHRHCREDVMPRAAADQEPRDRAMCLIVGLLPARGPANDFELMIVARADDVATGVGKGAHGIEGAGRGRPVHRVGVVAALANVHVEAALQQQLECRHMGRREVEQCPLVRLCSQVQLLGVRVE